MCYPTESPSRVFVPAIFTEPQLPSAISLPLMSKIRTSYFVFDNRTVSPGQSERAALWPGEKWVSRYFRLVRLG